MRGAVDRRSGDGGGWGTGAVGIEGGEGIRKRNRIDTKDKNRKRELKIFATRLSKSLLI